MPDCENCNERCPQAEMAHEIALGRMYATQELVRMVKQVESGKLVDVVHCRECAVPHNNMLGCPKMSGLITPEDFFCAYGERKTE